MKLAGNRAGAKSSEVAIYVNAKWLCPARTPGLPDGLAFAVATKWPLREHAPHSRFPANKIHSIEASILSPDRKHRESPNAHRHGELALYLRAGAALGSAAVASRSCRVPRLRFRPGQLEDPGIASAASTRQRA